MPCQIDRANETSVYEQHQNVIVAGEKYFKLMKN